MGKAESKMLDEVYQEGRKKGEAEVDALKGQLQEAANREHRMAECHQAIGRIQAARMFAKFGNISELMWVRDVKDLKIYKDLPGVGTWEKFCNTLGFTAKTIDEKLENLHVLGVEFSEIISDLRVSAKDIKKLRQLTHEGALQVEDGVLVIGDEEIPLDSDHREDLQAAMERLLDAKEQVIAEKDQTIRTKERLIQDKQKLIERQAKDLARYEGDAEKKGLLPIEDAFIQKCTNARTTIDGFLLQFDPDRNALPEDATPRMKAALMETLGYFRRAIVAAHDTAGDLYGDAEMDSPGWVQPNLREAEESLGASLAAAREKRR